MTANLRGQSVPSPEALGTLPLASEINSHVGTSKLLITRPAGARTGLVLMADKGSFRVRSGDVDMPSTLQPAASVTDGTGGLLLSEGAALVLAAPSEVSIQGYAADSVVTYYWL